MNEMKVVLRTLTLQTRLEPAEQADEKIHRRGVGFSPSSRRPGSGSGARARGRGGRVPAA